MDALLLTLLNLWLICISVIIYLVVDYAIEMTGFIIKKRSAPDCCMCGASDPTQCSDHQYLSQLDWFESNFRPLIK